MMYNGKPSLAKIYWILMKPRVVLWLQATAICGFLVYDLRELQIILNNIGDMQYEIIGAGSNLLVRDNCFKGIIFKLGKNQSSF